MARFSIILPVKNGGEYIKQCVQSILVQTLGDFNLIILDSCSNDGTVEWIKTLTDPRIVFHAADIPLTIEQNWGRILSVPRNEWMTIIGHDDLLHPQYLETMNSLILKHPDASLYATHLDFIDSNGRVIRECRPMKEIQRASHFLEKILVNDIDAVSLIMRSADYDRIGGIPLYPNLLFSDFVLWMELARLSYIATAKENRVSYRVHSSNTTNRSMEKKFYDAYEQYIQYLYTLKQQDPELNTVINKNVKHLIRSRCLEFSNKLLNTPKANRQTFKTVMELAKKHRSYATMLIDNNTINPVLFPQILAATIIDSNPLTQKLYHLARRIF